VGSARRCAAHDAGTSLDPDDARASLVRLTSRGRAFARAIRAFAREVEDDWARRVGARRLDDLRSTLELLRASLAG
jgi:DNA-binding MarR family transcriptional regulator